MVGDVVDGDSASEFVPFHPGNEGQAEVLTQLQVDGQQIREPVAVGGSHVILKNVDDRVWKPRVYVEHRTRGDLPGQFKPAPGNYTVGNVRVQVPKEIRTDNRLLKGDVDLAQRIQITACLAVDI